MSRLVIYCDGSCVGNGYSGALAGAGVYFGPNDTRNQSLTVPGAQTNNRGEVWAIIKALEIEPNSALEIKTDSQWAIKCATKQWKAKENLDLLKLLWDMLVQRDVVFTWVKGHSKDPGNEAADKLAKLAVSMLQRKRKRNELSHEQSDEKQE